MSLHKQMEKLGALGQGTGDVAGLGLGIGTSIGAGPLGVMPKQGQPGWIGDDMGSPLFPGQLPGSPWGDSWPQKPWGGVDWIAEKARQEQEAQERRASQEALARLIRSSAVPESKDAITKRQCEQARTFAEGVESAQGALGARHHFRQALAAGHAVGMRRCWSALIERAFDSEVLGSGKSETLMAAALGAAPEAALAFLFEAGFEPGPLLASQALLAALSASAPVAALERLMDNFGAGSLAGSALSELEKRKKGLGEKARANGESYELGEIALRAPAAATPSKRI